MRHSISCFQAQTLRKQIAIQTEQFLMFVPVQDKLTSLLLQFQQSEHDYEEMKSKLEYYEFKSNMVEQSLHELTYAFSNKLCEEKLQLINDIERLDEVIKKEEKWLKNEELVQRTMKQNHGKDKSIKNTNNIKATHKNVSTQFSSTFSQEAKPPKTKNMIPPFKIKPSTNLNQKQNSGIKNVTKLEAQLNLKAFMNNFESSSRSQRKSLNSTFNLENSLSFRQTDRNRLDSLIFLN